MVDEKEGEEKEEEEEEEDDEEKKRRRGRKRKRHRKKNEKRGGEFMSRLTSTVWWSRSSRGMEFCRREMTARLKLRARGSSSEAGHTSSTTPSWYENLRMTK